MGSVSLAPWANGGMGTIGDTRSVSGLHEGSQSAIGDGGQGDGVRAILRTHHRKNNLGFFACINKLSRHYSCPLLTVHQLRYARIAIGVRPYRNWSTTVSQLEYGGQMALTAPKKRSFDSQKRQEITRVPSLAIPVRQW